MDSKCQYCGEVIKSMIFKGSGFCSVDCKKGRPHSERPSGSNSAATEGTSSGSTVA